RDDPAVRLAGTEDRLQDFAATRAHESGQADDLPGPHGERHVAELPGPAQTTDVEQDVTQLHGRLPRFPERSLYLSSRHEVHELGGRMTAGVESGGDRTAVLDDGDSVADAADLLQPVRDVDHRDALVGEFTDDS